MVKKCTPNTFYWKKNTFFFLNMEYVNMFADEVIVFKQFICLILREINKI